jgi:5-(carboxyamino)imidazole ribonucleotide mutase
MEECRSVRHGNSGDGVSAVVGIVMGSSSDHEVLEHAAQILERFAVPYEIHVVSAHRTPEAMIEYGRSARERGLRVIIAGAGGAAHLPGMLAAVTTVPVIGVPVALARLDGLDSLLSIVQMPRGVPVATVAINGATNAGLLAVRILALDNSTLATALEQYRDELSAQAREQDRNLPR